MSAVGAIRRTVGGRAVALVPVLLVGTVLLMVVPLPALMLDFLLAASIGVSLALLLIAINIERPLDLSAFPAILLFVTLLRLALNVASTRLILLHGAEGSAAAGRIIEAFGEFMIAGNYVVGGTVFALLVIINFVVITKGAGRVAEVSARFTLDAMPGKQMSIDSDLAAGAITQEQAKVRRKEIEQESDFFGAMDGASKFVRGDAIAGLLMTAVNIVVGFIVGVAQNDLSAAESASTYTILTVGDGLASQIPALLISTAAGVVVTRAAAGAALAPTMVRQLSGQRMALYATASLLGLVGLLPGMPIIPFALLAAGTVVIARVTASARTAEATGPTADDEARSAPTEREKLEELLPVHLLELEVGYELVPLVDAARGGELVERIAAIRRNLAMELGIIVPAVNIRDNLRLKPNTYVLKLSGNEVGQGELRPSHFLAMDASGSLAPLSGEEVREPAFGLPARWIPESERLRAETLGYTVVDSATVAATHVSELLRSLAADLLGRTQAQELLDLFARREPRLVDELIPNLLTLGEVLSVLRMLLREGVSIRDLRTILECLADHARETRDPSELTERTRQRLARHITARFRAADGSVAGLVMDPRAEEAFRHGGLDASSVQRMLASLDKNARAFGAVSTPPLVLCAPDVRKLVSEFLTRRIPGISVVSYREIDPKANIHNLGVVSV